MMETCSMNTPHNTTPSTMTTGTNQELITNGYGKMVRDKQDQGCEAYLITLMFNPLKGLSPENNSRDAKRCRNGLREALEPNVPPSSFGARFRVTPGNSSP